MSPLTKTNQALIAASSKLARELDQLEFPSPIVCTYNPLDYAWASHELYLKKYADSPKKIIFLGMNPGPWGMAQTGIPFGEVSTVRDWLGLTSDVKQPKHLHPQRPILGFNCKRSEVSGRRLWGLFKEKFHTAEKFFENHFVVNYCPLLFYNAEGQNITPDKLKTNEQILLFNKCNHFLNTLVNILKPQLIVGVGVFAEARAMEALSGHTITITRIPHPSPANPAANKGWAALVNAILKDTGMWT